MKNIIKILSLTVVIAFISVSCELNRFPYDSIEQSQSFMSIKDAGTMNNGLYSTLRGRVYGLYMYSTDVQADLLNATLDYGNRNGFPHKWNGFLADDYTIRDTWAGYYGAMANLNNIIINSHLIPLATTADTALMNKYMGDAYFLRAFYYHQLIQRYAKDYEPATAATDPGVPLVLTFDISAKPARATVDAVYQQILDDIAMAEPLLSITPGVQNSSKITIDCVTALKARVYLCMHNWTAAATSANALITGAKYPLISNAATFKNMWVTDGGTETIFQLTASQPSELGNANNIYLGYNATSSKFSPDFLPEQWVIDQYEAADIRKAAFLEQKAVNLGGVNYAGIWCINKYPGNPALFTAATSNYQHKPKIFRIAEMYLISAEAAAQTPATEGAALATLNALRTARGATALVGLTGTALMDAVKAERVLELLCEGTRIDDLKRWNMGFTRKPAQNVNLIIVGADCDQKVVAAGDNKFVWAIPTNDMTTNPSLAGQQNPGW
jgi:starch-binding outer membrane protein, SusD/RagB family